MVALYVMLALFASWLLVAVTRRSVRGRGSIERYHRALDVLSDLSERGPRPEAPGPPPRDATPPAETRPPSPAAPFDPVPRPRRRIQDPERPILVFTDESLLSGDPETSPRRMRHRWIPAPGWLVAVGVATGAAGLGVGLIVSVSPHAPRAAETTGPGAGHRKVPPAPRPPGSSSTTTSSSTSTTTSSTTTTTALRPGGAPVLSAISPAAVDAGGSITLTGTGFASADGRIVATVDSRVMPTRCPTEERCVVTVLPGLHGQLSVRLVTDAGTSNPVRIFAR